MAIITCQSRNCTAEIKNGHKACVEPTVEWTGLVLALRERNMYDDSDFLAQVWDEELGQTRWIEYGTTRCWTYHNHAHVDATPDVIAKAEAYTQKLLEAELAEEAAREAARPTKGKMVRSLTTRGKNKGIEGKVMWYGEDQYANNRYVVHYRVGIKVEGEDKLRYLPAYAVEVI